MLRTRTCSMSRSPPASDLSGSLACARRFPSSRPLGPHPPSTTVSSSPRSPAAPGEGPVLGVRRKLLIPDTPSSLARDPGARPRGAATARSALLATGVPTAPRPQTCPSHFLSQNNIPFHRTDNKARLFQLYTNTLQDSTLSRPSSHDLPGSRRRTRDIDLAQLIHPTSINPHIPRELLTSFGPMELKQPLPARSKDLTVAEFAFAFSLYRDIICSAFPNHRYELDDYLSLILNLALRFGGNGFYSYHILFASQAAGCLQQFNQDTYWGTLDHELYCRVFAARASLHCEICGAPSHPATACTLSAPLPRASVTDKRSPAMPYHLPLVAPPQSITPKPALDHPSILSPLPKGTDRRGRPVLYQGGRMICNNFNDLGCSSSSCKFLHTCSFCGGAHARAACPHNPAKQQLCKHLNTPVNINALATALQNHPDTQFVNFLIQGFTYGFHLGLQSTPESTHICNNLQSALSEPTTIDRLLQKEVDDAFMICPFSSPPFPSFRVSPIGVATRKYSRKKRLIIDLSSPHGFTTHIYHLKRSKTNQSGQPQPIYLFRLDSYISPYEPIHEYISTRLANRASPQDPLFITEMGRVATRFWFHHHMRSVLARSGIPPDQFSGHSFRIGAASTASRQGIPDNVIKILGRWSSPAYHTYIHHDLDNIKKSHSRLSG
eukprot:superscaffoldBa00009934_g24404